MRPEKSAKPHSAAGIHKPVALLQKPHRLVSPETIKIKKIDRFSESCLEESEYAIITKKH
jgi:hypothetical protein